MAPFHLYWVSTHKQWDDGFVVARTTRAASAYVRHENFAFHPDWSVAERLLTLPDHLQDSSVAVLSTAEDQRHVHWASPEVLSACGVDVVHAASPRVFLWKERLLTEGVLDYVRRKDTVASDRDGPTDVDPRP